MLFALHDFTIPSYDVLSVFVPVKSGHHLGIKASKIIVVLSVLIWEKPVHHAFERSGVRAYAKKNSHTFGKESMAES